MIELQRAVETGDKVKFSTLVDLMQRSGHGTAAQVAGIGVRIEVDHWEGAFRGPPTVDAWTRDVKVVIDETEVCNWMLEQFKLIAAQDQGLGGNATPEQCWISAQRIAREVIARFPKGITG